MAIQAGTCVGVLYYKVVNGKWSVGVHNGITRNVVTANSVLILGHVSNAKQFNQAKPTALLFYPTLAAYQAAVKNPPKPSVGIPFGVRIATKVTAPESNHACAAFLQSITVMNKNGNGTVTNTIAHNGKFIQYTSPKGAVFKTMATAIQSIKDDPGGTLLYFHYNLVSRGGGIYDLVQEKAIKSGITALRFLK